MEKTNVAQFHRIIDALSTVPKAFLNLRCGRKLHEFWCGLNVSNYSNPWYIVLNANITVSAFIKIDYPAQFLSNQQTELCVIIILLGS